MENHLVMRVKKIKRVKIRSTKNKNVYNLFLVVILTGTLSFILIANQRHVNDYFSIINIGLVPSVVTRKQISSASSLSTTTEILLPNPVVCEGKESPRIISDNPEICTRADPAIIIYVLSSPSSFAHRTGIRNTWGSRDFGSALSITTMFVLGKTKDGRINQAIQWESRRYQDVLHVDILDSYFNLSLKSSAALWWVATYCPRIDFAVKVDDDTFINVIALIRFLHRISQKFGRKPRMLICSARKGKLVNRKANKQWFVHEKIFPEKMYPTYCLGYAYVIPQTIVVDLYQASCRLTQLWIEDIYITGICARTANVTHLNIGRYYAVNSNLFYRKIMQGNIIFSHLKGNTQLQDRERFWQEISRV